jgi:hypothetical protein
VSSFQSAYAAHGFAFWLALLVALFVVALWTWRVQRLARDIDARYSRLFDGASEENTASMLAEYLGTVRRTAQSVAHMQEQHDRIVDVMPSVIRHVGLVRFSPFHDTGSDQSFAIALLDGRRNGLVITALHSRTDSRLYAKPVERGTSPYSLTPEEREAMHRALGGEVAAQSSAG